MDFFLCGRFVKSGTARMCIAFKKVVRLLDIYKCEEIVASCVTISNPDSSSETGVNSGIKG
jgi:hypothetical protein